MSGLHTLLKIRKKKLQRICEFIGIERGTEELIKVIKGTTFEKMKDTNEKFGFDNIVNEIKWNKTKSFIGKGSVTTDFESISEDLIKEIKLRNGLLLKKFDYKI